MNQEKIILDMTLGDGYIAKPRSKNGNCSLRLNHSTKQADYLVFKKNILESNGIRCSIASYIDKRGYGVIYLISSRKKVVTSVWARLYKDGKKVLTPSVMKGFDSRSLAILFQDDGSRELAKFHRSNGAKYAIFPYINTFVLNVQNFDEDSRNLLMQKLQEMGIESRYGTRGGPVILISKKESKQRLIDLIKPFMCQSMEYKIGFPVSYHGKS